MKHTIEVIPLVRPVWLAFVLQSDHPTTVRQSLFVSWRRMDGWRKNGMRREMRKQNGDHHRQRLIILRAGFGLLLWNLYLADDDEDYTVR